MEAIGTLAGGIAHDFNNILAVIMGYTELSLDNLGTESPEIANNLRLVLKSSERAKKMIQQILMFSRKSIEEMIPVDLGEMIKETINFLKSSLPSTIKIVSEVGDGPNLVLANPTQMNQILMNLSTNAAHAMKDAGGVLSFDQKKLFLNTEQAESKQIEPGSYLMLSIRDTGSGMSKDMISRIFEPYFTTKKPGEGTGMGLAVVHGIVKAHLGCITVESKPGRGSVFEIFIPEFGELDQLPVPDQEDSAQIRGGDERILLVDDEPSLARMSQLMLEGIGYKVIMTTNSQKALDEFKSEPDKFDLLITDMTMPGMTGIQLAAAIHKIRPGLPVILITGYSDRVNESNYLMNGIDSFVLKPIIKRNLAKKIRAVLDS